MFDFTGLFSRGNHDDATAMTLAPRAAETHPRNYMVHKDGKPFAILNATPALAERTLAGFRLATPASTWSFERL